MTKYIATFGIEIHAALDTKTKAFSPAENVFGAKPNTRVHPVDLAYPGAKPRVNGKMVEHSYRLASSLNMEIESTIFFDRKNYFYPDLSAGYQITQFERPIGRNGKLTINTSNGKKDISITEIHMEQDTAKQTRKDGKRLFDFNRAGTPLIEIVSGHEELASIEEVIEYVKTMREQLVVLGISRAILAEGTFRVDINVSVRPENQKEYGTRVEIKNINSFSNIEMALNFEINSMKETLEAGNSILPVTKRFDENKGETVTMRIKDTENIYNFIPEGNITPIKLTEEFISNSLALGTPSIMKVREELKDKLNEEQYSSIMQSGPLFKLFRRLSLKFDESKVANFISQTLMAVLKSNKDRMTTTVFDTIDFELIMKLMQMKKVTNKDINSLLRKALLEGLEITNELYSAQETEEMSEEDIEKLIINLVKTDERLKTQIEKGSNVTGFLTGQVMKATKGQALPATINKIIDKVLK